MIFGQHALSSKLAVQYSKNSGLMRVLGRHCLNRTGGQRGWGGLSERHLSYSYLTLLDPTADLRWATVDKQKIVDEGPRGAFELQDRRGAAHTSSPAGQGEAGGESGDFASDCAA